MPGIGVKKISDHYKRLVLLQGSWGLLFLGSYSHFRVCYLSAHVKHSLYTISFNHGKKPKMWVLWLTLFLSSGNLVTESLISYSSKHGLPMIMQMGSETDFVTMGSAVFENLRDE